MILIEVKENALELLGYISQDIFNNNTANNIIVIGSIGLSAALSCKLPNFSASWVLEVHLVPLKFLLVLKCSEFEFTAKFIGQDRFSRW